MTQTLISVSLPKIRLQCLRVPVRWTYEIERLKDGSEEAWFTAAGHAQRDSPAEVFDPWEKRGEFFQLKEGDHDALREFLDSVGAFLRASIETALEGAVTSAGKKTGDWEALQENYRYVEAEDGSHKVWGDVLPLSARGIWMARKVAIREMKAPTAGLGFDVWPFSITLPSLKSGPAAVITTVAFQEALALSVRIDHLRRAKIQDCKRPDCAITFAAVGPRKRKFCSWYCGHLTTVRKWHALERAKKRGKKHGKKR
jgi:hypothetical protein